MAFLTRMNGVAFSPDGQVVAAALEDGELDTWQAADGRLARTMEGHASAVKSVAFSPDGVTMASGSDDNSAGLWQFADGSLVRFLNRAQQLGGWRGLQPGRADAGLGLG